METGVLRVRCACEGAVSLPLHALCVCGTCSSLMRRDYSLGCKAYYCYLDVSVCTAEAYASTAVIVSDSRFVNPPRTPSFRTRTNPSSLHRLRRAEGAAEVLAVTGVAEQSGEGEHGVGVGAGGVVAEEEGRALEG